MQITHLNSQQAAEILDAGQGLAQLEGPGTSRTHVLTSDTGRDITIIVCGSTGEAVMVDECRHDQDAGGSVHHHARAIAGADNG